jgi:O-antigen ligase
LRFNVLDISRIGFRSARWLLAILLALSLIAPGVIQSAKIGLLFAALVLCIPSVTFNMDRLLIWWPVVLVGFAYSFIGLVGVIHGVVNDNPGALSVFMVHVVYPVLFSLLSILCISGDLKRLSSLLINVTALLIAVQGAYLASAFGWDGGVFFNLVDALYGEVAVVDPGDDYLLFTLPNIATHLFVLPFLIVLVACRIKSGIGLVFLVWASASMSLLSGRRTFFVSTGIALFVAFVIGSASGLFLRTAYRRIFVLAMPLIPLLIYAISVGAINPQMFIDNFASIIDFSADESNIERKLQFRAMMAAVSDSPFFGDGAGAVASYIRSPQMPWAYELYYIATAFQFGIVGFIAYAIGVVWLLVEIARLVMLAASMHETEVAVMYLAILSGMIGFFIAAGTNPYLAKFDYMWTIFMPFALLASSRASTAGLRMKRSPPYVGKGHIHASAC